MISSLCGFWNIEWGMRFNRTLERVSERHLTPLSACLNAQSPVCIFSWSLRYFFWLKVFPHSLYLWVFLQYKFPTFLTLECFSLVFILRYLLTLYFWEESSHNAVSTRGVSSSDSLAREHRLNNCGIWARGIFLDHGLKSSMRSLHVGGTISRSLYS